MTEAIVFDKFLACKNFFAKLSKLLEKTYTTVGSCNQDSSVYLVPAGTESEITYYSKPSRSFRISDHWNWYSNINKCSNPNYIQCLSVDVPYPRKREIPGKATKPRVAFQVAMIGNDGKYHAVYGEVFNRNTKTWSWLENTPERILEIMEEGAND
ncbi:MAG: hypothetical protein J6Y02_02205 [Pseudobutyrivibrio sp.]|nr:hypothetical protein [Pseudobutyrivibrio sp.]